MNSDIVDMYIDDLLVRLREEGYLYKKQFVINDGCISEIKLLFVERLE